MNGRRPFPNPQALRVFLCVAQEGSVGRAALSLGMTQPGVSQHLQALETQIGQALFHRQGRRLVLTKTGQDLLPQARRVVQALEEFVQAAQALERLERGRVEIGAATTMAVYVLPRYLTEFKRLYPEIRIKLESGSSERLTQRLLQGELELAVVEAVEHLEGFERQLFYEDELVVIVPPEHPWARKEEIAPEQLAEVPLIVREPGAMTFRVLGSALEQAGLEVNPIFYTDNHEVTKRLVLEGAGVGIVSSVVVRPNVRVGNLRALRLKGLELRRLFWLFYPKELGNPAAEALKNTLLS
ncbi:LysR family transcriptional regulator [Meiothermus taiwanensis]|jgi:DNA-binding transcriptional LysR family regulator|uniref:HTH-type transcriptional regulator CysL n=2 Tax=Meiothermus taiwanensis TaxID=172827 RepID=A0A399EA79_9DEIN|nr:LysR family transcriptional regulator [Meiothermus taiwanensis]AWR85469.1 transcriptional regulator, LysR family [Meiothermus taiwanensis WR-220]KIQ55631.1 LysR family transcriptional regulator [Meiothermus taiwanensis]KZK16453.1 LysR family transcriptional regulator [Meiothermus taiwanensis]RIH80069.1 HTH-type transcriptional regulator CysL [Meiothermus taiwanensis]